MAQMVEPRTSSTISIAPAGGASEQAADGSHAASASRWPYSDGGAGGPRRADHRHGSGGTAPAQLSIAGRASHTTPAGLEMSAVSLHACLDTLLAMMQYEELRRSSSARRSSGFTAASAWPRSSS